MSEKAPYAPAEALPDGARIRPMESSDLSAVLEIIGQHDEDDQAEAAKAYKKNGLAGEYVLDIGGHVAGVTGARPLSHCEAAFRLSWTYLHPAFRGQGLGKMLVQHVLDTLRITGGRKVFAESSDYHDPQRGDIYAAARELYRASGFEEELRHAHYYDRNESLIVYGMRLRPPEGDLVEPSHNRAQLGDVDEIPETDDAYFVSWQETDGPGATSEDVRKVIRKAERWEARVLFVGVPSHAAGVQQLFEESRFQLDGRLRDYYADGVDEIHYRYDLS